MTAVVGFVRSQRGVALLVTLAVTTLLVTMALEYNRRARYDVIAAAAARDHLTMTEMAAAGVHVAMAILVKDKTVNDTDTPLDDWADPEKIAEALLAFPFEAGQVALAIEDELGKIQVNALVTPPDGRQFNESQRTLWERFLQYYADRRKELKMEFEDDSEPQAILNSLKDWMDSGDDDAVTGLSGAETSYYMDKEPPYPCRNGPLTDLNELLLIKGITPELYHGTREVPGIARYLTVYGMEPGEGTSYKFPGRINLTTADLPVLFALLPVENQDLMEAIDELRRDIAAGKQTVDLKNLNWLEQIPGMAGVKLDPKLITMVSDVFRVESTATLHDASATIRAVVQRVPASRSGKWSCRLLSWQIN